jgi:ribosomal protein S27E
MCIPSYYKYLFLAIIIGSLIILSVFYDRVFYLVPAFIFAIAWSRIRCPKCTESILKDKNGWYIFTMRSTCRHCGQDTLLCEIEPDEVTSQRIK